MAYDRVPHLGPAPLYESPGPITASENCKVLLTAVLVLVPPSHPTRFTRAPTGFPLPQAAAFRRRAKWVEFDGRSKAVLQAKERLAERKEEVQRLEAAQEQDTKPIRCVRGLCVANVVRDAGIIRLRQVQERRHRRRVWQEEAMGLRVDG